MQSWLCGVALRAAEPAAVALVSSHGYESASSKTLMRWTVIVADLLSRWRRGGGVEDVEACTGMWVRG